MGSKRRRQQSDVTEGPARTLPREFVHLSDAGNRVLRSTIRAWGELKMGRSTFLKALLVLAGMLFPLTSFGETYTVQIRDIKGAPVPNVRFFGTNGFNSLPNRTTDRDGLFAFDSDDLKAPALITFANDSARQRFEPSELVIGPTGCPGRRCLVTAHDDPRGTTVLTWNVRGSNGRGVPNVPVTVSSAVSPCQTRSTDSDGNVVFAVYRALGACNDGNTTTSDNFTTVTAESPKGTIYSFADPKGPRFTRCLNSVVDGFFVATGRQTAPLPVTSVITYRIFALTPQNTPLQGVTFTGPELGKLPVSLRTTGATGFFSVSTTQLGISSGASWSLAAQTDYDVYPKEVTISPQQRVTNDIRFMAFSNFQGSGALIVDVREAGVSLGGVKVESSELNACGEALTTNSEGRALLAFKSRSACNDNDFDHRNDTVSVTPQMAGCDFTESHATPFQRCPSSESVMTLHAYCREPAPQQRLISGSVFNLEAAPLPNASILRDGALVATTGSNGSYFLYVDEYSSPSLRASAGTLMFDPQSVSIDQIDRNHSDVNFVAVGPTLQPSATPAPPTCPVAATYEITGQVTALDGKPLEGAVVSVNHEPETKTDARGNYTVTISRGADAWVTVDSDGRRFDPAGAYYPNVMCNLTNNVFEVSVESFQLVGRVVSSLYEPMPDVAVTLEHESTRKTTSTDEQGYFLLTVPEGANYVLRASLSGHDFVPAVHAGEGEANETGLDFRSIVEPTPLPVPPTPIPTIPAPVDTRPANPTPEATPRPVETSVSLPSPVPATPMPTVPPTSTPRATVAPVTPPQVPTVAPTPSPSPRISEPTPTPSPIVTNSPAPSATAIPTATVVPPSTPTAPRPAPSATPRAAPSVSPTIAPTATPTRASPAPSPEPTTVPTATPRPSATPDERRNLELALASICSSNPEKFARWSVTNGGSSALTLTWDLYGSQQGGTVVAGVGTTFFETGREEGSNTLRLFSGGVMVAVERAQFTPCVVAPAPSPGAPLNPEPSQTPAPTTPPNEPAPISPTPSVVAPPPEATTIPEGPTPLPTVAPAEPTVAPTPTPTPRPTIEVRGMLTDNNGRRLSAKMLSRLEKLGEGAIKIVATNRYTAERFEVSLDRPFRYTLEMPMGEYRIRLLAPALKTLSRQSYRLDLDSPKRNVNFAVRMQDR